MNNAKQISVEKANPSDVHLSLINTGIIEDPFYRDNEEKSIWVGEEDWIYSTDFVVDRKQLKAKSTKITFEGIDTHAEIYINGNKILQTDNMFVEWELEISGLLRQGKNELKIFFKSPITINKILADKYAYKLPEERAFTRKAAYQFGWDWGPKIVNLGIWKNAYIEFHNKAKIDDILIHQKFVDKNLAALDIETFINSPTDIKSITLKIDVGGKEYIEKEISLLSGKNRIKLALNIKNPNLWWPVGLGNQDLYQFDVKLLDKNKLIHQSSTKTGLRNIEVIQETDNIGKSFYFKVNGKIVFAKGANYIPQDNFLSRVDSNDYFSVINSALESNMNMLRVWGGGIYENDIFYDLCDEKGIMVWQDFMFAGSVYPNDKKFLESIKTEAIQNVKRLRNHPSIVLWCGNNEIKEAWYNWGWQKSYSWSKSDSIELWNNYQTIFEGILPSVVNEYSAETFYWASSPSNGWGRDISYKEGDVHYWGVWWGKEPFEKYNTKVGRFMSEYGFQGMPSLNSIKKFTKIEDLDINSKVMSVHQKHPFGWENIKEYMERDYPDSKSFEQYIYLSQLMQAEGISLAIEAHRRAKPYCMGTLYWQLNDCWPVTSWSSVDYYGEWKALHYYVKKAYDKYLISFEDNKSDLDVFFISDDTSSFSAETNWKLIAADGKIINSGTKSSYIPENSSTSILKFNLDSLSKQQSINDKLFVAEVFRNNIKIGEANKYFTNSKELAIKEQKPDFQINRTELAYEIVINSNQLLKAVQINCKEDGFFSDNYFDVIPNQNKIIYFKTESNKLTKKDFNFIYLTQ